MRKLRKSNQQENPKAAEKIDRKTRIELPRVILDSPTGPVELTDLKLRLKTLQFAEQCNQQLPVIGIESLSCHVKYPTEDKKIVECKIDVNDLKIMIQADWGQALHDYVYTKNFPKALATLISKIKRTKKKQPLSEIWVSGQSIELGFPLNAMQTLTQARSRQEKPLDTPSAPSPDQLAELITRQLLCPVHMSLEQLTIAGQDGQNKTPVEFTANGVKADLTRVNPQAGSDDCTTTVDIHADNARTTLNPRSGLTPQLVTAIPQKPELQALAQTLDQQKTTLDLNGAHVNLTQTMVPIGDGEKEPQSSLKTRDRQATIQVQQVKLGTVGSQQGEVRLEALDAKISEDENKTVTVTTCAKTGQLDVTADQLALPTTDVTLHGSVNATIQKPSLILERQGGEQLTPTVGFDRIAAKVSDTLTLTTGQNDITVARGTTLTKADNHYELSLPELTIEPSEGHGPIQLSGLSVQFQPQPLTFIQEGQQRTPVVALASLNGTLTYPLATGGSVSTDLNVKDLKLTTRTPLGTMLHTLSQGQPLTIEQKNLVLKPDELRIEGKSLELEMTRDSVKSIIQAVLTPEESNVLDNISTILEEAIANSLVFPVHIGFKTLVVKGDEETPFTAQVNGLTMGLTGIPAEGDGSDCNPTLTIDTDHTELSLQQASGLVRETAEELKTRDPLSALTGFSSENKDVITPEPHSQQLTINLNDMHAELSQSLKQNRSSHGGHHEVRTQNRQAEVKIQTVNLINKGNPTCALELNDLNCQIKQDQQKNVTGKASSPSGEIDIQSEIMDLPKKMSAAILNGQVSTQYRDLDISVSRPADGTYLKTDVTAASMTLKVKDTLTAGDQKSGAYVPNETTMHASGTLFHCDKDKVFVSPQLQRSGNSNVVIIKDGLPTPFYLEPDAQIKDASYIQFSNRSSFPGTKNTTRVVSCGDYSIKDIMIGRARVNFLNLSMDKNLNGYLKADKASVDLDKTVQIKGKNKPVNWYTRLFLKKKKLVCSLETPICEGNIDLKRLKIKKLEFTPTTKANLLDRIICKTLNWFVCPILKRYCKLSTKLHPASKENKQKNVTVQHPPYKSGFF